MILLEGAPLYENVASRTEVEFQHRFKALILVLERLRQEVWEVKDFLDYFFCCSNQNQHGIRGNSCSGYSSKFQSTIEGKLKARTQHSYSNNIHSQEHRSRCSDKYLNSNKGRRISVDLRPTQSIYRVSEPALYQETLTQTKQKSRDKCVGPYAQLALFQRMVMATVGLVFLHQSSRHSSTNMPTAQPNSDKSSVKTVPQVMTLKSNYAHPYPKKQTNNLSWGLAV